MAAAARPLPDRPVTHLGRTLLSRTDVIVRARLTQVTRATGNGEIGRLVPDVWLRGEPPEDDEPLLLLASARGAFPPVGRDALFLLAARPPSTNLDFLDAILVDDADGAARLDAFRQMLRVEAAGDTKERRFALRSYLARALDAPSEWTRWNAAREYAALAAEFPEALTTEDRATLESAARGTGDRAFRTLLEQAIAACPGAGLRLAPRTAPPAAATSATKALDAAVARFDAPGAPPAERRQAVVDAAVGAGPAAAPLVARALDDADPAVREAAAAAAGQLRMTSLEPRIAALLVTDQPPAVRHTLVIAAGHLRSSSSVGTLALLAKAEGPLATDAAFALARIRSEEALAALRTLRAGTTDGKRADLLEYLVSDRFVESERALTGPPRR